LAVSAFSVEQSAAPPRPELPPEILNPPQDRRFKSPAGRARAVVVTFYVVIAASLYGIFADVYGLRAVNAGLDDKPDADAMLRTSDTLDIVAGLAYTLPVLVLIVLFLMWFARAYGNLPALGIGMPPRSTGWAVGSWFVPFVAWVVPLFSANDIWRSGDTEAPPSEPWYDRPVSWIVGAWWAAWVVTSFLGNIVGRAWWGTATELEEYKTAYTLDLVSLSTDIVAALLAIAFVRRATARQQARAEQIEREGIKEPPPRPPAEFTTAPAWKPADELGSA
jgi:hypothetical protein